MRAALFVADKKPNALDRQSHGHVAVSFCRIFEQSNPIDARAVPRPMTPELFDPAWFAALATIIVIDIVLAGDNAIVIGLAARNVPRQWQRRVVLWGTAGAIVVRILLTAVVVWLLQIPAFLLIGGSALVYIAWKLTQRNDAHAPTIKPLASVRGAITTIVIADAVMGVDNVLAIGGAAHGSML